MLYATTRRFLEVFGLESLKQLPSLRELDELAREQGLLERTNEDAVSDDAAEVSLEAVPESQDTMSDDEGGAESAPSDELDDEFAEADRDSDEDPTGA
jgi:segregation and condensation protein B